MPPLYLKIHFHLNQINFSVTYSYRVGGTEPYPETLAIIMSRTNFILLFVFFTVWSNLFCQDSISLKDVYLNNEIAYKIDGERFTGIAQSKRKNGHLVYEEVYNDGVVLLSNLYFNGKQQIVSDRIEYNRYKLWTPAKEYRYNLKGQVIRSISYDENGLKVLVEEFQDGELVYSCQYNGRKKHGVEFCFTEEGEKLMFEYINGKKQKKK